MKPVVLASKSAVRADLLRRAGVRFAVVGSGVDEGPLKHRLLAEGAAPAEVARRLAQAKGEAVAATRAAWVIGADQTLEFEGELFDKAASAEEARRRLARLRGRTHQLHSAVVLTDGRTAWAACSTVTLHMRPFSEAWLDAYVARAGGALTDTVGGYEYEAEGVQLFERVDGDYFALLGLPLLELLEALREVGAISR